MLYMFSMLYLLYGGFRVGEGSYGLYDRAVIRCFSTMVAELLMNGQTVGKKVLKIK